MRKLPKLEVVCPYTEEELLLFRHKYLDKFMFISAGTGIIPELKKRVYVPEVLISLANMKEYNYIDYDKKSDTLKIGALTKLKSIINSKIINEVFSGLSDATKLVAMPQIRNVATIGGNICLDTRCYFFNQSYEWRKDIDKCYKYGGNKCNAIEGGKRCFAVFCADLPIILISVDAKIKIMNEHDEEIVIPLQEFYTGKGKSPNILKSGEFVKEIIIENITKKDAFYKKFRLRQSIDFPACSVAVSIKKNKIYKVVLGAVDSCPVVVDVDRTIEDDKSIEEVCTILEKKAKPVNNFASTPYYRKKMAGILFKKIIRELR